MAITSVGQYNNITNKLKSKFLDTKLYLYAGMNLGLQTIQSNSYNSPFNYILEDIEQDTYKAGYLVGARMDITTKNRKEFAFGISLQKLNTGTHYEASTRILPFINNFSQFKADEQLVTLNISTLYKKIIPITDTNKLKLYFLIGPNLDLRLSEQSEENQVSNAYHKLFISSDIGIELDNQSFYTLFFHYKRNLTPINQTPIQNIFNRFEVGVMIKANDIF
jgi:hypothetical protein